jgi:DNA-binding PadR family transcriptional regulator
MITDALDPLIHAPARLRIAATLAVLPGGDTLRFTRLQDMTGLSPGTLITCLAELEDAGYVRTEKAGRGATAPATAALTHDGRGALDRYAAALRHLPARVPAADRRPPRPEVRIGDADRDAAAAALGEHFARGRLTLDELDARLDAAFAAATYGEISSVTCDLPDLPVPAALPPFTSSRRDRARQRRRRRPDASHGIE